MTKVPQKQCGHLKSNDHSKINIIFTKYLIYMTLKIGIRGINLKKQHIFTVFMCIFLVSPWIVGGKPQKDNIS